MYNLSVIIPHYNSPLKLRRLLETIPDFDDIEVIIIDDRSDKELEILEKLVLDFSSENTKFYYNERENKGAGVCRNIGLEKVQGKWILFADADDYFLDDFYNTIKVFFKKKYDIIFFPPISSDINNENIGKRHKRYYALVFNYFKKRTFKREFKLRYKYHVPWSKLYSKDFIDFYEIVFGNTLVSNDALFSVKSGYYARNIAVSNQIIYNVTESLTSLSKTPNSLYQKLDVHYEYLLFLNNNLKGYRNRFELFKLRNRFVLRVFLSLGISKKTLKYIFNTILVR